MIMSAVAPTQSVPLLNNKHKSSVLAQCQQQPAVVGKQPAVTTVLDCLAAAMNDSIHSQTSNYEHEDTAELLANQLWKLLDDCQTTSSTSSIISAATQQRQTQANVRELLCEQCDLLHQDICENLRLDSQDGISPKEEVQRVLAERIQSLQLQIQASTEKHPRLADELSARLRLLNAGLSRLEQATSSHSRPDSVSSGSDENGISGMPGSLTEVKRWLQSRERCLAEICIRCCCSSSSPDDDVTQQLAGKQQLQALQCEIQSDGHRYFQIVRKEIDSIVISNSNNQHCQFGAAVGSVPDYKRWSNKLLRSLKAEERRWHRLWIQALEAQIRLEKEPLKSADSEEELSQQPLNKRARYSCNNSCAATDFEGEDSNNSTEDCCGEHEELYYANQIDVDCCYSEGWQTGEIWPLPAEEYVKIKDDDEVEEETESEMMDANGNKTTATTRSGVMMRGCSSGIQRTTTVDTNLNALLKETSSSTSGGNGQDLLSPDVGYSSEHSSLQSSSSSSACSSDDCMVPQDPRQSRTIAFEEDSNNNNNYEDQQQVLLLQDGGTGYPVVPLLTSEEPPLSSNSSSPCLQRRQRIERSPVKLYYKMTHLVSCDTTDDDNARQQCRHQLHPNQQHFNGDTDDQQLDISDDSLYVYTNKQGDELIDSSSGNCCDNQTLTSSMTVNLSSSFVSCGGGEGECEGGCHDYDDRQDHLEEVLQLLETPRSATAQSEASRRGTVWKPFKGKSDVEPSSACDASEESDSSSVYSIDADAATAACRSLVSVQNAAAARHRRRHDTRLSCGSCHGNHHVMPTSASMSFVNSGDARKGEGASASATTPSGTLKRRRQLQVSQTQQQLITVARQRQQVPPAVLPMMSASWTATGDRHHHSTTLPRPHRRFKRASRTSMLSGGGACGMPAGSSVCGGAGNSSVSGGRVLPRSMSDGEHLSWWLRQHSTCGGGSEWEWDDYTPPKHREGGEVEPRLDGSRLEMFGEDYDGFLGVGGVGLASSSTPYPDLLAAATLDKQRRMLRRHLQPPDSDNIAADHGPPPDDPYVNLTRKIRKSLEKLFRDAVENSSRSFTSGQYQTLAEIERDKQMFATICIELDEQRKMLEKLLQQQQRGGCHGNNHAHDDDLRDLMNSCVFAREYQQKQLQQLEQLERVWRQAFGLATDLDALMSKLESTDTPFWRQEDYFECERQLGALERELNAEFGAMAAELSTMQQQLQARLQRLKTRLLRSKSSEVVEIAPQNHHASFESNDVVGDTVVMTSSSSPLLLRKRKVMTSPPETAVKSAVGRSRSGRWVRWARATLCVLLLLAFGVYWFAGPSCCKDVNNWRYAWGPKLDYVRGPPPT